MPLQLIRPKHIALKVRITPPQGDPVNIGLKMKYLDVCERTDYLVRAVQDSLSDEQILEELIVGWSGISGEDGKELPFTPEVAQQAFRLDYILFPARDAVLSELQMERTAQKNS